MSTDTIRRLEGAVLGAIGDRVPTEDELGDMVRGAGSIVSVYARVPTPVALVTLIVNDAMPSAVGVPVNAPAALSDNPAGSLPPRSRQL